MRTAQGFTWNESCRVELETALKACIQHAFSLPVAIERCYGINANHAQNSQATSSDLTTRIATARCRIIRARFNNRSTQAFPKADHRSSIGNAPLPNSNIDAVRRVCLEAAVCLTENYQ